MGRRVNHTRVASIGPPLAISLLALALITSLGCASSATSDETKPDPTPSVQPLAAPPVTDAAAMRDQLLRVAREKATTDTATAFGLVPAWKSVFPRMKFVPATSAPATDTVSGGDLVRQSVESEITQTVSFVVVDTTGRCTGGYMAGAGRLTVFDPIQLEADCSETAVYKSRNPDPPPPEPEETPAPRRTSSGKSGSTSGGSSGPTTRRGGVEQRPLGDDHVTRPAPA